MNLKTTEKLILPVAFALPFFLGFEAGGFQLALIMISESFDIGTRDMGTLVSLQYGGTILGPVIFGSFISKAPKKSFALLAITLFSFGCFTLILIPVLYAFFIGVFILGIGFSLSQTCSSAILSDAFPGRASKYINWAQCFFSGGAVISPILTSHVIATLGISWKFIFYVSGLGYLLLILPILWTRFADPVVLEQQKPAGYMKLIRTTSIAYLVFAIFIYVGVETGLVFFLALMFTDIFKAPEWNAYALSAIWLAMIPARIISGILYKYKNKMMLGLFLTISMLLTGLAFSPNTAFAMAICVLAGLTLGPVWPTLIGMGTEESPENASTITGLLNVASGIGGALFPIIMGFSAAYLGIRASYIFLGFCCFLAFLSIWLWKKSRRI